MGDDRGNGGQTHVPGSIFDDVETKLQATSPDPDTMELWADIRAAFDDGGPTAVKTVIDERVRRTRLAVEKDLKTTRSVTKSTATKKRAPAKRAAAARKRR